MNVKGWVFAGGLSIGLVGCATIPPVTVSYYFPKAESYVQVTQTIGCSAKVDPNPPKKGEKAAPPDHRRISVAATVSATTAYSADLTAPIHQGTFQYDKQNGTFIDGDASVTLTSDGRLSGVNVTTAGQGGAVIKDLVTLAAAIAVVGAPANTDSTPTPIDNACDQVDSYAALGASAPAAGAKPPSPVVSLTYSVYVTYDLRAAAPVFSVDRSLSPNYPGTSGASFKLRPDAASQSALKDISGPLGDKLDILLNLDPTVRAINQVADYTGNGSKLELPSLVLVNPSVTGRVGDPTQSDSKTLWSANVPVPTGKTFHVPVPEPALFGKTAFSIALSDAGTITTLHYGSNSGAPDATDALGSIAKALQPESTADKAKEVQAQADLIAQQQRLIRCQVSPVDCK
jgi:hypothetical protein